MMWAPVRLNLHLGRVDDAHDGFRERTYAGHISEMVYRIVYKLTALFGLNSVTRHRRG